MTIEVANVGPNAFIAILKNSDEVIFTSSNHPRPGCALRDVINYLHLSNDANTNFAKFEIVEWS